MKYVDPVTPEQWERMNAGDRRFREWRERRERELAKQPPVMEARRRAS